MVACGGGDADRICGIVAPWFLPLADRFGWAYESDSGYHRNLDNHALAALRDGRRRHAQPLNAKLLRSHLARHDRIHYNSSRRDGLALLGVDVDAHQGQLDAHDAVQLIAAQFCGMYNEPSPGPLGHPPARAPRGDGPQDQRPVGKQRIGPDGPCARRTCARRDVP